MGARADSTIRFSDGTELPIDWVYPDAPQFAWEFEREHWPDPLTPMEVWIWQNGQTGADRAWQEARLEPPPMFRRFQTAGPFLYVNVTEPPLERIAEMAPAYVAVAQQYGSAFNYWKTYCEPRIRQACDDLASLDGATDLRAAAETLFYGFHQTFTCLGLLFLPSMRLSALLTQSNLVDELTNHELTQGGDNATQDIDEEIFNLAELARETPAIERALRNSADVLDGLRTEPDAATFVAAFDALIKRHGSRSLGWMFTLPTWRERPDSALALVRAQVLSDRVTPDELRERSAARRRAATERVLAALPSDKHDEFRSIIGELDGYVPVREGRAYWQLVIVGEIRALLLRVGEGLARLGRIDRADDIFFVTPDDLASSTHDLRDLVMQRRTDIERWRRVDPPKVIGTPGATTTKAAAKPEELRGSPASRGVATGKVRVLHSPDEGDKLQRGDILVCVLTTPAWTPLFAIAGGVVTETGGALSHPAITAREYGIPAVVALESATTRLKDGDLITVDGGAGTVSLASVGL